MTSPENHRGSGLSRKGRCALLSRPRLQLWLAPPPTAGRREPPSESDGERPAENLGVRRSPAMIRARARVEEESPSRSLIDWALRHRAGLYALPLASAALAAGLLAVFEPGFYRA